MNLTDAKLSNYNGQAKKDRQLDSYLIALDRDIQNLWKTVNSVIPFIGANPLALETNTSQGFSYIPFMDAYPQTSPTNYTGHAAVVFCRSDSSLHVYNTSDSSWKFELLT